MPKEHLPVFTTGDECRSYCVQHGDPFYLDAFMLEAWIGSIIARTVEEYAEKKSGNRHLQTGIGYESWKTFFGGVAPEESGHLLQSLARFGGCDSPNAEVAAEMFALVAIEDRLAEPLSLAEFSNRASEGQLGIDAIKERASFMFERMSEWMEALVHWHVHWMAATAPIAFGATEQHRELANIGLMQAGFSELSKHGKEWWSRIHEELAEQFQGKAEWRIVGKAQSFEKFGELRQPFVDELTIHWWPLLKRYHWTDRDMRSLLRSVAPHPGSYPLREDKEFADYRKKALGLIKGDGRRDKSAADGKPPGWRAAIAMVKKLSE